MWDLKKNPPETMDVAFLFWNQKNRPAFTSTQSASPQDWVWNCIYVSLFIHSFTYSYFWKNRPAFTSTQSASPQHWLWIDLFKCIFCVISFFQLIWFILNTGMTFLFWNHSIIAQHVFTSTQSASPRDWVLNCIYVSLFIHSFIHLFIFFLLLFICFTLFNLH